MKPGTRALGVAESYDGGPSGRSTLCGAVVRADRVVDGVGFATCTVGGTDATDAILDLFHALGREDVRYLFVAGIAPAWFNVVDLRRLHAALERPVASVSFEESPGLGTAIREHFEGEARRRRLATYRAQPPRTRVAVGGETVFVRGVGGEDPAATVRAFTPEGGRPEPLRVARLCARAARRFTESA